MRGDIRATGRVMEKKSIALNPQAALIQSLRVVQVLWLAELVLVAAIWLASPLVASAPRVANGTGSIIALALYIVGLADIILGLWLRERAFGRARAARSAVEALGRIVGPSLVSVTLALTPAILGLVLYLVFGNRTGLGVLCVLSLIGLAVHRPRQDRWQEIMSSAGIHAHRPA